MRSPIRRGSVSIEILLITPVLITLVLALVSFALRLAAGQRVDEASSRAARILAQGGDKEHIDAALRRVLGERVAKIADVELIQPNGSTTDLIEVKVSVPAKAMVPDLLAFIGLGLGDQKLIGQTVMIRE